MKKLAIAGASAVLAAMPVVGVFATTTPVSGETETDTFTILVNETCTLDRVSGSEHTADTTTTGITSAQWSTNAYSATMVPGTYDAFATSGFSVSCNHANGYQVSVNASDFAKSPAASTMSWTYNVGEYASSNSSWYLTSNGTGSTVDSTNQGNIVLTEDGETSATPFTITYNTKIDAGQDQGSYTATAAYALATID